MTQDDLKAALGNANVQAFLRTIRVGEGTADEGGYARLFGGGAIDSFASHPNREVTRTLGGRPITSTAAGAYQFLYSTWTGLVKQYAFPDFSPESQDMGAVALIAGRKALDDVIAGRVQQAIAKCAREWASLPGSPYGQPTVTLEKALEAYAGYGGKTAPNDAPVPLNIITHEDKPVDPFTAAALGALIQTAPALIRVFGDSPQAEKNAKAAELVASVAKQVTQEPTVEGAVNAMQADPAKAASFREEVHQNMGELLGMLAQATEIDEKTRGTAVERNLTLAKETGGKWLWLLGAVAGSTVLFAYFITWKVLFAPSAQFSEGVKMLLLGQIVLAGFALVMAFLFGTNLQNRIGQQDQADKQ